MNSIVIIILAILVIAGGWYLLKNYDRFDIRLFANSEDGSYSPSGKMMVILAGMIGAVAGGIIIAENVFKVDAEMWVMKYTIGALFFSCLTAAFMQALLSYRVLTQALGKCAFMFGYCLVAFILGVLGSWIVFAALIIYMFVMIINLMFKAGFERETIRTKGGLFESGQTMTQVSGDIFEGPNGTQWRREGNKLYSIPRDEN